MRKMMKKSMSVVVVLAFLFSFMQGIMASAEGSNNCNLSNLVLYNQSDTVVSFTTSFSSGTTSYTARYPVGAMAGRVVATTADSTATVTVNGVSVSSGASSQLMALSNGASIVIVVTAQDGTTKTYTISIGILANSIAGNGYNYFYDIVVVSDGYVAVGKYNQNNGTGDWAGVTGYGGNDAIIVKYNTAGEIVWKRIFGGSDADVYKAVVSVSDGYIAIGSGVTNGTNDYSDMTSKNASWNSSGFDIIMVKYDTNGNIIWKKNFGGSGSELIGNSNSFAGDKLAAPTPDGDFVICGYVDGDSFETGDFSSVSASGRGLGEGFVAKFNSNGVLSWVRGYGASGN